MNCCLVLCNNLPGKSGFQTSNCKRCVINIIFRSIEATLTIFFQSPSSTLLIITHKYAHFLLIFTLNFLHYILYILFCTWKISVCRNAIFFVLSSDGACIYFSCIIRANKPTCWIYDILYLRFTVYNWNICNLKNCIHFQYIYCVHFTRIYILFVSIGIRKLKTYRLYGVVFKSILFLCYNIIPKITVSYNLASQKRRP